MDARTHRQSVESATTVIRGQETGVRRQKTGIRSQETEDSQEARGVAPCIPVPCLLSSVSCPLTPVP